MKKVGEKQMQYQVQTLLLSVFFFCRLVCTHSNSFIQKNSLTAQLYVSLYEITGRLKTQVRKTKVPGDGICKYGKRKYESATVENASTAT